MDSILSLAFNQRLAYLNSKSDRFWRLYNTISLRRLHFFVWIWCRRECPQIINNIHTNLILDTDEKCIARARRLYGPHSPELYMAIHEDYMRVLLAEKKERFDPFARKEKTTVSIGHSELETTIGQISFFHWIVINDVDITLLEIDDTVKTSLSQFNKESKRLTEV